MSKKHIFILSALLLAGTSGAALAQQGANGPATSVPAPSGGPVGSPTTTPGATSGVNPNAGFGSSSAGGSGGTGSAPPPPALLDLRGASVVTLDEDAFNKLVTYKRKLRNHLLEQVEHFRVGDKQSDRENDLLDTFCYGIALAFGNSGGF
jgi:hypothetical protein